MKNAKLKMLSHDFLFAEPFIITQVTLSEVEPLRTHRNCTFDSQTRDIRGIRTEGHFIPCVSDHSGSLPKDIKDAGHSGQRVLSREVKCPARETTQVKVVFHSLSSQSHVYTTAC